MSFFIPRNPTMTPGMRARYKNYHDNMNEGIMIGYDMNKFRSLHINSVDMISLLFNYFIRNKINNC